MISCCKSSYSSVKGALPLMQTAGGFVDPLMAVQGWEEVDLGDGSTCQILSPFPSLDLPLTLTLTLTLIFT